MRILVEAIRELIDAQLSDSDAVIEACDFDAVLRETVDDLRPVAETRNVRLTRVSDVPLIARVDRRFLDSALSLTRKGSDLRIVATTQGNQVCLVVSWKQGTPPQHSPFSRQELGLLIAQVGLEEAGAEWTYSKTETPQTCIVRLPLASHSTGRQTSLSGGLK
jgi:hypothetical protein